ncbi:hypothetical protein Hanom_Chr08g00718291 [Helianthus anomalus]
MEKAEIVVSTYWGNKKLLDAIKMIPDQANYSWFSNVYQIVFTTNCYCYRMKPDELISLIKSYDKADKQKAQGNTSAIPCSSTHATSAAPLPAAVCSSTSADSSPNSESGCYTGTQIHDFTHTPTKLCVDDICCTSACREKVSGYKEQANSLIMQLQLSKSDIRLKRKSMDTRIWWRHKSVISAICIMT